MTERMPVCDGVLPMKVKDEIILKDWVYKIVIPMKLKEKLQAHIPCELKDRVIYIENDCKDIWDWSEKVYRMIENCTIEEQIRSRGEFQSCKSQFLFTKKLSM